MSEINWNDVLEEQAKDPGIGALPANKYNARVKKAEAVKASSGNPMIKLQLEVVGGPYDTRVVWTNIVFSTGNAKAMKYTLRKLAALGVTREVLAAQNPSAAQIASMIEGREVEIDVEVGEYNGEPNNDVKSFKALTGLPSAPSASAPSIPTPTVPNPPTVPGADEEPF